MEIQTYRSEVLTKVSNKPRNLMMRETNTVQITLDELIQYEPEGAITVLRSYCISFNPQGDGFSPHHFSRLLLGEHVPGSQYLGQEIVLEIDHQFASDPSLQRPVFVAVNVKMITEWTRPLIILPTPPSSSPRGASGVVFQRLAEEQRVETKDLVVKNETQCMICIDDLSSKTRQNIIELPQCLHIFHQDCLFEWLRLQNSCPLCRRAPYEYDQEH